MHKTAGGVSCTHTHEMPVLVLSADLLLLLQIWEQEFAWAEGDKPIKLAARALTVPEGSSLNQQPIFCFETMMKMWYWSCLVYDYQRVRPAGSFATLFVYEKLCNHALFVSGCLAMPHVTRETCCSELELQPRIAMPQSACLICKMTAVLLLKSLRWSQKKTCLAACSQWPRAVISAPNGYYQSRLKAPQPKRQHSGCSWQWTCMA